MHVQVLTSDGEESVHATLSSAAGEAAEAFGRRAGELLIARGAHDLLTSTA